jgi:hypothetical protein
VPKVVVRLRRVSFDSLSQAGSKKHRIDDTFSQGAKHKLFQGEGRKRQGYN